MPVRPRQRATPRKGARKLRGNKEAESMSTAMQNNELTKDGIFDILRTDIRRQLLTILDDADGMAQEELAGRIADRIDQDEQEVRVALVHGHLPMLESCAVIHWSDGEVQHGKQFDRVMKYLSTLDDIES